VAAPGIAVWGPTVTAEAFCPLTANVMTTARPAASESFLIMSFSFIEANQGGECPQIELEPLSIFGANSGSTVCSE